MLILQPFRHFTYITTHSPTLPSLYLHHSSFSNPSIASPTSQFILQPFFCFSYVTNSSLNSPGKPPMSLEGPVSQIHSPCWCPWDLFRSFKVCSDAKERVRYRKQWEATAPIQSLVKLQLWFLSLWWKTCVRQNYSLGSCDCSETPALGQNTLRMMIC